MYFNILKKLSFGAGPRLPTERCGKTNCSNNARLNCVGIACPRWLPAIPAPQKIGFYPIWGQRLKTQLHGGFQANLAPWKNAQPVVGFRPRWRLGVVLVRGRPAWPRDTCRVRADAQRVRGATSAELIRQASAGPFNGLCLQQVGDAFQLFR